MKIITCSIAIILIVAVVMSSGCVGEGTPIKVPETKIVDETLLISPGRENVRSYELKDAGTYRYEFTADKPVCIWLYVSLADFKLAKLGDGSARIYADCSVVFPILAA